MFITIFLKAPTQFLEGIHLPSLWTHRGKGQTSNGAGPMAVLLWAESLSALSSAVDPFSTGHSEICPGPNLDLMS